MQAEEGFGFLCPSGLENFALNILMYAMKGHL